MGQSSKAVQKKKKTNKAAFEEIQRNLGIFGISRTEPIFIKDR